MKKNLQRLFFTIACLLCCVGVYAVPANPNPYVVMQPDGTAITLQLCGDEFYHYYIAEDGSPVTLCDDGYYRYTTIDAQNNLVASADVVGRVNRTALSDKQSVLKRHGELYKVNKAKRVADIQDAEAPMRRVTKKAAASNGVVKGIIVLAQFQDQKFTYTQSDIHEVMNKAGYTDENGSIGSARDYFVAQSYGQFQPEFNVVGPVTLSQNMAYYGANSNGSTDVRPDVMVSEACELASQQGLVDMSDYDSNGDGWVDLIYVIYAGYPESSGAPAETIWPHAWYIYRGAGRTVVVDGVKLDAYACSSELCGNQGQRLDGIGSFCHEYSHTLGLPDWYDIDYSGAMGMSWWSLMASGCYAGAGYVPVGYNAYERFLCGWLQFNELTSQCSISMPELNTDKTAAYKITSTNKNQYITLETRRQKGWDTYLPAEGMMVIAVDYDQNAWDRNGPNDDPLRQRFKLIPADNNWSEDNLYGDLYPYKGNTSLTSTSSPNMKVYNTTINNKPITNIAFSNGVVTFDFMQGAGSDDNGDYTFIRPGNYTWSYELESKGTERFTSETTFADGGQFPLSDLFSGADGMMGTNWSISGLFNGDAICDELQDMRAISYTTSLSGETVEVLQLIDAQNADSYYYSAIGKAKMYDENDNLLIFDIYLADVSGNSILHPTFVAYSDNEFVFDGSQLVLFYIYEGHAYLYDYVNNVTINRSSNNSGEAARSLVGTYSAYANSAFEGYPDETWTVTITQDANDANKVWIQPVCLIGGLAAEDINPVYAYVDAENNTLKLPLGQTIYSGPDQKYNIVIASIDGSTPDISGEIVVPYFISGDEVIFTIDFLGAGDIANSNGWWYQALSNISYSKITAPADEVPEYLEDTYQAKAYNFFNKEFEEWSVNITIDKSEKGKVWIHPVCFFGGLDAEYINPVYATYNASDNTLTMPLGQILFENSNYKMVLIKTTDFSDVYLNANVVLQINKTDTGVEISFAEDYYIGVVDILKAQLYQAFQGVTYSNIVEGDEVPEYLEDTYQAEAYNGYGGALEEWSVNITIDKSEKGKVWIHPGCLFGGLAAEDINPVYATYNASDNTLIMPLGQVLFENTNYKMVIAKTTDGSDIILNDNIVMQINQNEIGVEISFAEDYFIGVGDILNNEWWYRALYGVKYMNVTSTNLVIYDDVASYEVNTPVPMDAVTYVRNFDNTDWQAWYVPFDVPYETLAAEFEVAYLNNVHQYDDNNDGVIELTELEAIKVTGGVLQANYPYIVKAILPGEKEIVVENATVNTLENAYDCASMLHRYYFCGTYDAISGDVLQAYDVYTLQQNMLEEHTDATMPLGAFRWYLQIEDRGDVARPQQIVLKVRNNPTDVEDVMGDDDDAPIEYYDLSGRRVEQPTHGIYIMKQGESVRKVVVNER